MVVPEFLSSLDSYSGASIGEYYLTILFLITPILNIYIIGMKTRLRFSVENNLLFLTLKRIKLEQKEKIKKLEDEVK